MNYYIDFDNTLYETSRLTNDMLECLTSDLMKLVKDKSKIESKEKLFDEIKANFNREHIYNIYKLAKFFGARYGVDGKILIENIEKVIINGKKYVFNDVEDYLKKIKIKGNNLNVLTYVAQEDLEYQLSKIKGSGLMVYFDNIIITSNKKYSLDLKYEEGIFIDDNPSELEGLSKNNPKELIRIRREGNKYSKKDVEIEGLKEYTSFKDLI